jgi:membrane-associated protease RseP (regulator of RpoE activity)
MSIEIGLPRQPTIIDNLRSQLTGIFSVVTVDVPQPPDQAIRFRGYLQQEPEMAFNELSRRFEPLNYTPTLARGEEGGRQDVLVAVRGVARPRPARASINLVLFLVTVLTTLYAGSLWEGGNLLSGVPFAFTLLAILGTHEFGHYFVARRHRAAVTLPYFIPMPTLPGFFSIGTMGAVIQLRSPIRNRKQLFDIGVAGPLAGLLVAIPLLIYGLSTSPVGPPPAETGYLQEGNSLLYLGLKYLVHGKILPGNGLDVQINSLTFAAWLGLFVTCLNLLPLGQLDGGHISYALLGRRAWTLARIGAGALLVLGFMGLTGDGWTGWFLWAGLSLVFGLRHPPPLNDHTPLDSRRKLLGVVMVAIFVLVFIPVPFLFVFPSG